MDRLVKAVTSGAYQDQVDALRQEHGFSQARGNAVDRFACETSERRIERFRCFAAPRPQATGRVADTIDPCSPDT